ncbi:MAG TPA: hypothetical protein PK467_00485 [Candidatus Wallbacteria bacterium]|nr:hypothetical protein [Candidatus Wallbacteria bacterium]
MSKTLIFRAFGFALAFIFLTSCLAAAQIVSMPGVPAGTPFLVHLSMTPAHQAELVKLIDELKKDKDFEKHLSDFKKKTGAEFPDKMLETIKKLKSFTLAAFLNTSNLSQQPDVLLCAEFGDENSAKEFNAIFKEIMVSASKAHSRDMIFTDKSEGALKTSVPSFKGGDKDNVFKLFEPRVIEYMNYAGLFVYQKYDAAKSDKIFKSVAEAFKAGTAVFTNKQIKADFDKIAAGANLFFYFDGAIYRQGAIESGHKEESEYVSSIALSAVIGADFSDIKSRWLVNLRDIKDKATQGRSDFIKNLISGESKSAHISEILPADTAAFFSLKLNLGEKFIKFAKPMIDEAKPTVAMMFGLSIEEDLFSWMNGEIFGANLAGTSEFYIGFGSKNQENAWKFFDKFAKVLKIAGAPFDFKDDNFSGAKVKTSAAAGMEKFVKDFLLTVGHTKDHLIIASSKSAFEKIAASAANKQSSLSAGEEFKKMAEWPASSFMSVYMDFDKFKLSVSDLASKNSTEFKGQDLNKFLKTYAMHAGCDAKTITGNASIKAVPVKFVLDVLDQISGSSQIKEAVESVKGRIK